MTLEECRRWSDDFARKHRITVEERTTMPKGVGAYAECRKRHVVVPPIIDEQTFAVRVHEFGHILAEDCTNRRPHYRNSKVRDWWHCLECEAQAWRIAMHEIPFTREMFRRLQSSLATYRRSTPAHPEAMNAARHIASDSTFAQAVQARLDRERRLEQFAEIQAIADEARRPRPLTRREQQWREIQQWSREAQR